jgi:hypothetical protein
MFMKSTHKDLPESAMAAPSFAYSLAKKLTSQGKNPADLFIVLAGLISGLAPQVAAECLNSFGGRG